MESTLADFFSRTNQSPPLNWLELPEVPLAEELMAKDSPQLPLNDFEERHQLKDQYLETQYRLHRYEATEPLRRAIQTYRRDFQTNADAGIDLESVNLYSGVQATGYALGNDGTTQRLCIVPPTALQDYQLDDSDEGETESLVPGTLVALSSDHFKSTCYVATVAENDGLRMNPPYIDVF
ncbi:hypothetical protein QQS21_009862 [Conoideocrella luteorostrata]|uniref:ZNFX1 domain-containing protein n=1 Tax=Conoideocrella luteorostrata TaxID=1105319 RepID=A0AAJ0CG49_9HYPO|nr:hypothetical protein QQS21_009862 [Conoideocrella luteorostrata]